MGIFQAIFHPVQYVLARTMGGVFDQEVRADSVTISGEAQPGTSTTSRGKRGAASGSVQQGFKPQYVAPLRPPRNDAEAQRLYNHIRTLAFYLDAIPVLGRRLPFNIGLDSILGFIPIVGDVAGLILSLYAVFLCALFGLPIPVLAYMLVNVAVDATVGLVPIVGDVLDVAFKANLRNLRLLEDHLIGSHGKCNAGQFSLLVPPSNAFMPSRGQQAFSMPARPSQPSSRVGANGASTSSANVLPDGDVKTRWWSTRSGQDFRNGMIDNRGAKCETSTGFHFVSVVPNQVFTTMRYERNGITLAQACSPLFRRNATNDDQWLQDQEILLFDRHMDRLISGVASMREAFPDQWQQCGKVSRSQLEETVRAQLQSSSNSLRIRLAITRRGRVEVTSAPLPVPSSTPLTTRIDPLAIPVDTISQRDRLLFRCKTDQRQMYDQARERVHATLGAPSSNGMASACFDVLMCAEHCQGHLLTESSIANIVVSFSDGRVVTPRHTGDTPLLAGLMRQELLRLRLMEERDIDVKDVIHAATQDKAKIYLCNALRGIIPVQLLLD